MTRFYIFVILSVAYNGVIIITIINKTCSIFCKSKNNDHVPKQLRKRIHFFFHCDWRCCITSRLSPKRPHKNDHILYLAAPQAQSPPPSYNAIDLSFNGYNWTYNYSNDTSQDMTPCQGNCMDPCTQQCSMSQDCCCCDPNMMAQTQMAAAPAVPAYQPVSTAILLFPLKYML